MIMITTPQSLDAGFLHGPGWRWIQAHRRAAQRTAHDDVDNRDVWIAEASQYLAQLDDDPVAASHVYPEISAAVRLWESERAQHAIRLLTLANCPAAQIAQRFSVDETVIDWIERLFCDVRQRRDATDWINIHLVSPLQEGGQFDRAIECQVAWRGGPAAAEVILNDDPGDPSDKVSRLAARARKLALKAHAALAMPLTSERSLGVVRLYFEHERGVQRLELDTQKFAHQCAQAQGRAECARERRAAAEQRARESEARRQAKIDAEYLNAEIIQRRRAERERDLIAEAQASSQRAADSPLAALRWNAGPAPSAAPPAPAPAPAPAQQAPPADAGQRRRSAMTKPRRPPRLVGAT